jgi:hypothetical protein
MLTSKKSTEAIELWVLKYIDRAQAIQAIKTLQDEWQEAAQGIPLHEIEGNVGMMLDDFARLLGITPEELA